MNYLDQSKVAEICIAFVEKWLIENNYSNILPESIESNVQILRAKGQIENILVQVKASLQPAKPEKLNEKEIDLLVAKANFLSMKAYVAYVIIDNNSNLIDEINWQRVN
jgi:hypothetical protein